MKKLSAAAALALAGAFTTGAALAEEITLTACTRDGKTATLRIDVAGGLVGGPTSEDLAKDAFSKAAREMNSDRFVTYNGANLFYAYLDYAGKGKNKTPGSHIYASVPTIGGPACTPE